MLDVFGSLSLFPRPVGLERRYEFKSLDHIVHYMDNGAAWRQEPNECCWLIPLDIGERVMYEDPILLSIGSTDTIVIDPISVFRAALAAQAENIILVHNHPSGRGLISDADRAVTRRMRKAGEILRIPVLDHVILAEERCRSIIHPKRDREFHEAQQRKTTKARRGTSSKSGGRNRDAVQRFDDAYAQTAEASKTDPAFLARIRKTGLPGVPPRGKVVRGD